MAYKPHAWDLRKRFKRICTRAGINDLRIHDLRHFATTMLFMEGVPDAIIRNRHPMKIRAPRLMRSVKLFRAWPLYSQDK